MIPTVFSQVRALVRIVWATFSLGAGEAAANAAQVPADTQALVVKYCADCHSGESPSGDVALTSLGNFREFHQQSRNWNKAVRVIRQKEMPPAGEAQPTDEERQRLFESLDLSLAAAAERSPLQVGHVTVRRLNRTEYNNTIRDLIGVDSNPARELPSDPSGYGFDNIGDVLFLPPVLMEKYLDITKALLNQVFSDPQLRARIVLVEPKEGVTSTQAAQRNLEAILPRAFRRPVRPGEVTARVRLFEASIARGRDFDTAMKAALESVLLSPNFLMRMETGTPGGLDADKALGGTNEPFRITDDELAVRLSYFLWSTMPDEELFAVARRGELSHPDVLSRQVERMIADPKSRSLADNFAAQWLHFREILDRGVDFRSYPGFNDGLRHAMYEESARFFDQMLRENGIVYDILDADYAYVNERLASHYGILDVKGREIRRVPLSDRRRGGVLGMGSILTVTSYPTRTSAVIRGKWVLEELLGAPPPPPPANVGSLVTTDKADEKATLRQRLEVHRQKESCASCHKQMDPIGFGLENFDGIGKWRDKDDGQPIDSTGELPGGLKFDGPAELKKVLLTRQKTFLRTMVEKMFIYAVGRPVEYYDERAIRLILDEVEKNDGRMVPMVQAIVASAPFQFSQDPANGTSDKERAPP